MPKFENLNNPELIGEIQKRGLAADAEKFPKAREIISDLERKIDALPSLSAEDREAILAEAAENKANGAPTPHYDEFYKNSANQSGS